MYVFFFFFNDTATTEIYTLSLHDALPILKTIILSDDAEGRKEFHKRFFLEAKAAGKLTHPHRSEEHTSELQSLTNLVCRLLLEKKKKKENKTQNQKKKHTKHTQKSTNKIS